MTDSIFMGGAYSNFQFWKDLWFILGKLKHKFAFWITIRMLSSAMVLYIPFALAKIIDFFKKYQVGDPLKEFYLWLTSLLSVALVSNIVRLASKFYLKDLGRQARAWARLRAFSALLTYSLAWHEQEVAGNKVQRINSGDMGINNFVNFSRMIQ